MAGFHPIKTPEDAVIKQQQGPMQILNPNIDIEDEDVLYHIALSNRSHDLKDMFQDVKFVCFGGSPSRMKKFAEFMVNELKYKLVAGQSLCNIAGGSDRYVLYKVGPVLSVSHGMGIPSLSIIFHEIVKLLFHAGSSDVMFFRIGTSGGLGVEPGTVIITEEAVDGILRPYMEVATLGMMLQYPAALDQTVLKELVASSSPDDHFETISGKTMCTYDFYEGQGRLDGAFCDYKKSDKMAFLKRIHERGVRNIEMESLCFAAYCHRAGIKSAVICVTLLDRLHGDQISTPHDIMEEWQSRPQIIVSRYIKSKLGII
ncbi:uridine phosphorylase 2 [Patella vulgata]|uniref:uridine phosphorylase 2 n=1 Tax=Patella vulgata TaxID=6465 RepID=UPI0021806A24|nr:uridine phosphorylase 2 [Patella vulgata]XP_050407002.1 uridine phosphorylase 2 [Patella vulgata]